MLLQYAGSFFFQTKRLYKPEDRILHSHNSEKHISKRVPVLCYLSQELVPLLKGDIPEHHASRFPYGASGKEFHSVAKLCAPERRGHGCHYYAIRWLRCGGGGIEFNACLGACEAGTRPQGRRRTLHKPLMGPTFFTCPLSPRVRCGLLPSAYVNLLYSPMWG